MISIENPKNCVTNQTIVFLISLCCPCMKNWLYFLPFFSFLHISFNTYVHIFQYNVQYIINNQYIEKYLCTCKIDFFFGQFEFANLICKSPMMPIGFFMSHCHPWTYFFSSCLDTQYPCILCARAHWSPLKR